MESMPMSLAGHSNLRPSQKKEKQSMVFSKTASKLWLYLAIGHWQPFICLSVTKNIYTSEIVLFTMTFPHSKVPRNHHVT